MFYTILPQEKFVFKDMCILVVINMTITINHDFFLCCLFDQLYQVVAETSPFLENNMEDYFLGGLNDMVGWSNRNFQNGVTLLEKGTR